MQQPTDSNTVEHAFTLNVGELDVPGIFATCTLSGDDASLFFLPENCWGSCQLGFFGLKIA